MVDGRELSARERRKQTWFSSNDTGTQFFTNSVSEEVLLNMKHSEEHLEKARSLLKRLGLYRYKDVHPASLSGGQKQRLAIACGVLSDRTILIFDEPTSALDPELVGEVLSVIRKVAAEGVSMVIVTHEMNFAREVADRILFMEDGVIVEDAPPEEFFEHPKNDRIRQFIRKVEER